MRITLTNRDSSGEVVTDHFAVTVDGERYEYDVPATGNVNVAEPVAEYLLESNDLPVEPYESESDNADESDE